MLKQSNAKKNCPTQVFFLLKRNLLFFLKHQDRNSSGRKGERAVAWVIKGEKHIVETDTLLTFNLVESDP